MAEAMGRRDLRQAVEGAEAQQQAKQPSVKDQLLAEQSAPQMAAGIDQLAAPNMESMDLASGGIIAFEEGGDVPGFYKGGDPWAAQRAREEDPEVFMSKAWFKKNFEGDVADRNAKRAADIAAQQKLNAQEAEGFGEPKARSEEDPFGVADTRSFQELKGPGVTEPPIAEPAPAAPAAAPAAGVKSLIDLSQPTKFERRASPFGQMSAEKVDVEGLKDRGFGEGLMRLGAGFLSAPGAKGVSAGIAGLAEQAGLTRKETNALKKDARDYDLNRMKAESAFEQGQDELGLKYTEAANVNKYRMASLAKEPDALVTAREALKDPKLAAFLSKADKGETLSIKDATTTFNDILEKNPKYARQLSDLGIKDPMAYRQFVITGLPPMQVVDTIPGKGDNVRS
jgi:hypothetical protein